MDIRWNQTRWRVLRTGKRWWWWGEPIFYLQATAVVNGKKTWALQSQCALISVRDRFGAFVPATKGQARVRVPRWQGE